MAMILPSLTTRQLFSLKIGSVAGRSVVANDAKMLAGIESSSRPNRRARLSEHPDRGEKRNLD
ncbi:MULTISPECIES: hypothetical protein [unclassified Bradyrhizobium]|uniref:hypothetical protein n=1 Tax=unclassified Bradyrhizobium TaxID=2631580 RepID=UPI0015C78B4D|nr:MULTISPECIES: hypothetical protein [unclassified Bradyrhizobium]